LQLRIDDAYMAPGLGIRQVEARAGEPFIEKTDPPCVTAGGRLTDNRLDRAGVGFPPAGRQLRRCPERTTDLLFRFLRQNGGRLSQRARTKEFAALTDDEAKRIEAIYGEVFGNG
jgi:hypothetical protein